MKRLFGLCMAIAFLCALIVPNFVLAAQEPSSDGMKALREALSQNSDEAGKIFRQDILFTSPLIQSELEVLGMVEGDNFKSTGELSFWVCDNDGSVKESIIPFYLFQSAQAMDIYFKTDKRWEKFSVPNLAADVTDTIATPNEEEIAEIIADTKEVTILQENEFRRIMLIKFDGNRIADSFKVKAQANHANEDALQSLIVNYLDAALRNADMWAMWTVDKRDLHTVTVQYNLSSVIQELARTALNDPSQKWSDDMSNFLETIAYYSELKVYVTYPSDTSAAAKKFELPRQVRNAKPVKNLFSSK